MKANANYARSLIGERFGRLTVISTDSDVFNATTKWNCICDCGNSTQSLTHNLLRGSAKSCGCLRRERASEYSKSQIKHGGTKTRLYRIWHSMKCRCYYEGDKCYNAYGAKGIKVCIEWLESFAVFRNWALANGYAENLTIDRIDVNGDYTPENCRWATNAEQANNRTDTVFLTYKGTTKPLTEWANEMGIDRGVLYARIKHYGWPVEKALLTPLRKRTSVKTRKE